MANVIINNYRKTMSRYGAKIKDRERSQIRDILVVNHRFTEKVNDERAAKQLTKFLVATNARKDLDEHLWVTFPKFRRYWFNRW